MFDSALEMIKKAGIFLILAQTVLHLCVSETYEKYIKMLVGIITAILLIFPVIDLIKENGFQDFESYRIEYEARIWNGTPDFEEIKDDAWESSIKEQTGQDF